MRTSIFTHSLVGLAAMLTCTGSAINCAAQAAQGSQATPAQSTQPATGTKPASGPVQAPAGTTQPVPPKVAVPEHASGVRNLNETEIKLSPGDVIQIQVENHAALDGAFQIPGVGKLLLPEAGEVTVAGLTVAQLRDNLQSELDKTLNNVFVRILLREVHSRHVAISGVLAKQGDFDIGTREYRLLDLIDLAGGLNPPPNRLSARLTEYTGTLFRDKVSLPLDIDGAYRKPDGPANFVIQPNDRVQIYLQPVVTHQIHILGTIPRQGDFPLDNNTTLLGLFGLAGFPNAASSLSTSYVIRDAKKIPLDLRPLLTGNVDVAANRFHFEDNDELYIPAVTTKFMVWGSVGRQGNYPYPELPPLPHLLDAITGSGEAGTGEYRKVQLIRTENGKQTTKTINVDRMIRKGLMDENILIKPDDIVFVPPKNLRRPASFMEGFSDVFTPLIMLSYFGIHPY